MEEDKPIFRIELNEKGAESIRRIHSLVKIIFWGSLAVNLLTCFFYIRRLPRLVVVRRMMDNPFSFRLLVYPLYLLVYTISAFFFYFYFLRFSRKAKESLALNEGTAFNESFQWIYKGLIFALITVAVHAAFILITNFLWGY